MYFNVLHEWTAKRASGERVAICRFVCSFVCRFVCCFVCRFVCMFRMHVSGERMPSYVTIHVKNIFILLFQSTFSTTCCSTTKFNERWCDGWLRRRKMNSGLLRDRHFLLLCGRMFWYSGGTTPTVKCKKLVSGHFSRSRVFGFSYGFSRIPYLFVHVFLVNRWWYRT